MLIEWLEPEIEKQIDEVAKICDSDIEIDRLYDEIICEVENNQLAQIVISKLNELEKMINLKTRRIIGISFREGFTKGLGMREDIKKCL